MKKNMTLSLIAIALVSGAAIAANAGAPALLVDGTYRLFNHPDGGNRPPNYGMRLDGLDGNNTHIYTFDFEDAQSDMRMSVDMANSRVRIFGRAWGGYDVGTSYQNPALGRAGLWQFDFTYRANVSVRPDGEIIAYMSPMNNGYVQPLFSSSVPRFAGNPQIALVDYNSVPQPSFHLDFGHRGFAGVSGWGWVNHSGGPHVYASDWLFTVGAEPIPSPTAASLGMLGLTLVGALRRRIG